jgi:glycosyltransferase involved in cell wall biosynthesis
MQEETRCAIYFSDYEGFGMPPVESLRAGIPCIASALPPICENIPARFTFDNTDEADFIRTLNATYDTPNMSNLPQHPNWQEVAHRCVAAMQQA